VPSVTAPETQPVKPSCNGSPNWGWIVGGATPWSTQVRRGRKGSLRGCLAAGAHSRLGHIARMSPLRRLVRRIGVFMR
jgi:hypothetical protein